MLSLRLNIQEICNAMKRPNQWIIEIEEGEKKGKRYRRYFSQNYTRIFSSQRMRCQSRQTKYTEHQLDSARKESTLGT